MPLPRRTVPTLGALAALNIAAWAWAFAVFRTHPALLGTATLAYSFGLRHAFDADHIAAIDNVTRKLMQDGQRPVGTGLFFSLGHSTVVVLATIGIATAAFATAGRFEAYKDIGAVLGTAVSSLFLLGIAAANIAVLLGLRHALARLRAGEPVPATDILTVGPTARLVRPLFRLIRRSWHMYPLGFLFGLGFDTATEIGLLGMAATSASGGLPIGDILVFPALFAAGMTLMDTLDSILMVGAYGWAFARPVRKLYYNLTVTAVSVATALLVGGVEALGLLANRLGATGPFWDAIDLLNTNLGVIGVAIVAIFLGAWALSAALYHARGDARLDAPN